MWLFSSRVSLVALLLGLSLGPSCAWVTPALHRRNPMLVSRKTTLKASQLPSILHFHNVTEDDSEDTPTFSASGSSGGSIKDLGVGRKTLISFLTSLGPEVAPPDLIMVLSAVASAAKRISFAVKRATLSNLTGSLGSTNTGGDKQKKLDVVANECITAALRDCGKLGLLASEEEDGAVEIDPSGSYVLVHDPLDGSSNIDASIPTGTIFGVYKRNRSARTAQDHILQPGRNQVAAGYCLYSSAVLLVLTLGRNTGTHVFTLDVASGDFILTEAHVKVPPRGKSYSLNEARYDDWPSGLQRYITDIKKGEGQSKVPYDLVYVCSLVADVHYVLKRGGMASNPRSHLRLVYEGNPMAMVVEEAGGKASTGKERILDILPEKIHQRLPIFVGSKEDIDELESYGDVQQVGEKKYAI